MNNSSTTNTADDRLSLGPYLVGDPEKPAAVNLFKTSMRKMWLMHSGFIVFSLVLFLVTMPSVDQLLSSEPFTVVLMVVVAAVWTWIFTMNLRTLSRHRNRLINAASVMGLAFDRTNISHRAASKMSHADLFTTAREQWVEKNVAPLFDEPVDDAI